MKKLFKLLLASSLVFSLVACSSDDEEDDDDDVVEDVIEVDNDWREELDGNLSYLTIDYNGEERDVIVQVASTTQLNFYFDQEEEELYDCIILPIGEMDMDTVLSTLEYDGSYAEFDFNFTIPWDDSTAVLGAIYEQDGSLTFAGIDSKEYAPSSEAVNTWYYNADLAHKEFIMDEYGNWITCVESGEVINRGFSITTWLGSNILDYEGNNLAVFSVSDGVLDIFMLDSNEDEYYWPYENSTYQ